MGGKGSGRPTKKKAAIKKRQPVKTPVAKNPLASKPLPEKKTLVEDVKSLFGGKPESQSAVTILPNEKVSSTTSTVSSPGRSNFATTAAEIENKYPSAAGQGSAGNGTGSPASAGAGAGENASVEPEILPPEPKRISFDTVKVYADIVFDGMERQFGKNWIVGQTERDLHTAGATDAVNEQAFRIFPNSPNRALYLFLGGIVLMIAARSEMGLKLVQYLGEWVSSIFEGNKPNPQTEKQGEQKAPAAAEVKSPGGPLNINSSQQPGGFSVPIPKE